MSDPAATPADEPTTPGFDLGAFDKVIGRRLAAPTAPPAPAPEPPAAKDDPLQEIAEDLLDLVRRLSRLEDGQGTLLARLDRIEAAVRDGLRTQAREVDQVRRDLLGEQRAMAARAAAEAVLPTLDKIRPIHAAAAKNRRRNEALANQLDAVVEALTGTLRALGFTAYEPPLAAPFDPTTMSCAGEAKGPPGVVLGVVQPGYRVHDIVFRPAGVLLAPPKTH